MPEQNSFQIPGTFFSIENGKVYYRSPDTGKKQMLKHADHSRFRGSGDGYGYDEKRCYYGARLLKEDYRSITDYKAYGWFKVDELLYWYGEVVEDNFTSDLKNAGFHYFVCEERLFVNGQMLEVESASFRVLNRMYAKDSKQVFCSEKLLAQADAASFHVIDEHVYLNAPNEFSDFSPWAADHQIMYYCGKPHLAGIVDPLTVQMLAPFVFKDKTAVYYFNKKVNGVDVRSFIPVISKYAQARLGLFTGYYRDASRLFVFLEDEVSENNDRIVALDEIPADIRAEHISTLITHSDEYALSKAELSYIAGF